MESRLCDYLSCSEIYMTQYFKAGVVENTWSVILAWEADTGGSLWVWGQPRLPREKQGILESIVKTQALPQNQMWYSYCLQIEPVLSKGKNESHNIQEKLRKLTELQDSQNPPPSSNLSETGLFIGPVCKLYQELQAYSFLEWSPMLRWVFLVMQLPLSRPHFFKYPLTHAAISNPSKHSSPIKDIEIEECFWFVMCALPRMKRHLFLAPQEKS